MAINEDFVQHTLDAKLKCDWICEKVPFHTFDIPANKMS